MLEGRYRLHWFATSQWINLVKHCIQESEDLSAYPDLLEMLARLATELDNPRFDSSVDFQDRVFRKIQLDHPSISRAMRGVLQFRKDDQQVDWNFSNSKLPLGLSCCPLSSIAVLSQPSTNKTVPQAALGLIRIPPSCQRCLPALTSVWKTC